MKKFIKEHLKQTFYFLAIIFSFFSCSKDTLSNDPYNLTKEERHWMRKFFHDLLFVEQGVYTLWGSKPITRIVLYHYTQEEVDAWLKTLPKEALDNGYVMENYDLPENWEKWEKISSRFPAKRYLFFKDEFDEENKVSFVYLIDILRTALVIQDNYELFRKEVDFDFHPLEIVLEMPNRSSEFWKKLKNSKNAALLWGILFGYGKENATIFNWKYFDYPVMAKSFMESLPSHLSYIQPKGRIKLSISNFEIPSFISFTDDDKMIVRYSLEREKIKKIYQNNDLLEITLKKLTSN